jgi:excisionase family DNA binding protein
MRYTHTQEADMATRGEGAWLTYPEAQRFSGLGRTKLWELICSGEVEAAKVGRAVRINRHGLDEYMRRNPYVEAKK